LAVLAFLTACAVAHANPQPLPAPVYKEIAGTVSSEGASSEITLQVAGDQVWVEVVSIELVRTSGAAANWAPALGNVATFTAGSIDERIKFSSAAVSTKINQSMDPVKPIKTDTSGRLYLRPVWDAGSNNAAAYKVTVAITQRE
jgi:hypothetical protein